MRAIQKYDDELATDVSELMELQGKASSRMPVVVGVFVALCVAGAVVMKSMRGVKTGVNDVTEADTISLAAKPCAGPGQNCEESKCCENKDHKCFVKNQWWASCKATCDTNEIDPYDNLKWNCLELNATVARMQCAKDHEDCRLNGGKCCNKDWTCYVKDEHWSNCNADCKQGEGANSYDKGSWSCEIHEFVCDALTNESLADSLDTAQKLSTCCQDQLCNGAPCTGDKADKCTFYEKKLAQANPCAEFPSIKIEKILVNNLGGYGPHKGKPPGMVYEVSMSNVGLPQKKAHLTVNTFTGYVPNYSPWNGLHGEWATINWKAGTTVGLVANFWDPETEKNLTIPRGYITFSDIDAGPGGAKEFVTVSNFFENYYVGDQTLTRTDEHNLSTTFWGNDKDNGNDNPEQHATLTVAQKQKASTLQFDKNGLQAAVFKFGARPASSPFMSREIRFGFQPTMLCSKTHMPNGNILDAMDLGQGNIFPKANGREAVKVKDFKSLGICVGKDCDLVIRA